MAKYYRGKPVPPPDDETLIALLKKRGATINIDPETGETMVHFPEQIKIPGR